MPVFESLGVTLGLGEVPLIVLRLEDLEAFVEELTRLVRGTALFSAQDDFIEQLKGNIQTDDFVVTVIEHYQSEADFAMIQAYLRAHDIMLDANARRQVMVGGVLPSCSHRMVLLADLETFQSLGVERKQILNEFAVVNATLLHAG
jgi:hypothetical protein